MILTSLLCRSLGLMLALIFKKDLPRIFYFDLFCCKLGSVYRMGVEEKLQQIALVMLGEVMGTESVCDYAIRISFGYPLGLLIFVVSVKRIHVSHTEHSV